MIALLVFIVIGSTIYLGLMHPSFGRLPQGKRLERIKKSKNYKGGKFQNLTITPTTTTNVSAVRAMWNFLFDKPSDLKPSAPLPTVKTDLHTLNRDMECVIWFGHSSVFIQTGGKRFLIDPVLTSRLPMSLMFSPFKVTNIYTPEDIPQIDYLIITHDHWDHLDYYTVKQLRQRVNKVVCGLGVGEHFERWGYSENQIVDMDWHEKYILNDSLSIHCLPARHFSGRGLKSDQTLWASFLIDGLKRIFISGDGGYGTHFKAIGDEFSNIDLAILENGQYNKDWRYIHTMPNELPLIIKDLKAKKVLTVHNSKFALSRHSWHEPLEKALSNCESSRLITPLIGEVVDLNNYTTTKEL